MHNPIELISLFKKFRTRYLVFQQECGRSGTTHFQGYVEFEIPKRFTAVKLILPSAHWEKKMGSRDQARDYCMKEDSRIDGPWEDGTWNSSGSGHRSDLVAIAKVAMETHSVQAVINHDAASYIKYSRGINELLFHTMPNRKEAPKVLLYYGPTGTGKTRKAYTDNPSLYRKPPDNTWFCGYYGQSTLLLDDFSGAASKMALVFLLQLLDRYPVMLPIKGSHSSLLATQIIITTNIHPRKWYDYATRETQYDALARRITEVYWFPKDVDYNHPMYIEKSSFFSGWFESCVEENVFMNITRPNTPVQSDDEDTIPLDYIDLT